MVHWLIFFLLFQFVSYFYLLRKYILFKACASPLSQLVRLEKRCIFSYLSHMHMRDKTTKRLVCECLRYNLYDCWWPTTFLFSIFFLLSSSLLHTYLFFFFFCSSSFLTSICPTCIWETRQQGRTKVGPKGARAPGPIFFFLTYYIVYHFCSPLPKP